MINNVKLSNLFEHKQMQYSNQIVQYSLIQSISLLVITNYTAACHQPPCNKNVWETCMVFFLQWCNSVFRGGGTYASNKDTCGPARVPMVGAGGRHPLLPWGFRGIQNLDSIVFGVFISKKYIIGL